jgi:transposase
MCRLAGIRNQSEEPRIMSFANTVRVAIELSLSSWLVGVRLPGAEKSQMHRVEGGDAVALLALIATPRSCASGKLGAPVDVACCFEAGRDGFWPHRLLTGHGTLAFVLEPTSILVNRRASG